MIGRAQSDPAQTQSNMTTFGCQKKTTKSFTFFNCFLLKVFKSRIAFFQQIIHSLKKSQRHKCNTKTLNYIKQDNLRHPKENYENFVTFFNCFLLKVFKSRIAFFQQIIHSLQKAKDINVTLKHQTISNRTTFDTQKKTTKILTFFNCFLLKVFKSRIAFFQRIIHSLKKAKDINVTLKYQAKSNMTTFGTQKKTTKNFIFFNCFLFQIKDSVFSSNSIIDISSYFYSFFIFYLLRQSKLLIKLKILQLLKLQT
eukprot:TRINITY_DN3656_c1_g1_i4.p1 TRINITY_DN3656_c1_g1~~TRINITY_DN3656_c1_g1_i4.p1  ORF type:complete len:254 (+),score=-20.03 TRINITY_DN3656_c1_g1_i4:2-763(+)